MRDEKYIPSIPDIKGMIVEIEKKKTLFTYGWHRDDLKELEDNGYKMIFVKEDLSYPVMIKKQIKNPDLAHYLDNSSFRNSSGEPVWPW
jgi:hypothetical protein